MGPVRSSLGEWVTSVNSRGQLRDTVKKFTEDFRCTVSFRTGLGQVRSWELFLSCCYVLPRQKHSSCELRFSQVASVLHCLLPQVRERVTCKSNLQMEQKDQMRAYTCNLQSFPVATQSGLFAPNGYLGQGQCSPAVCLLC